MVSHIYIPMNVIVRLLHPRSGDSQGRETFLAPSADIYIYIYISLSNMSYIESAQWLNRAIFFYSGVGTNKNCIFHNFKFHVCIIRWTIVKIRETWSCEIYSFYLLLLLNEYIYIYIYIYIYVKKLHIWMENIFFSRLYQFILFTFIYVFYIYIYHIYNIYRPYRILQALLI